MKQISRQVCQVILTEFSALCVLGSMYAKGEKKGKDASKLITPKSTGSEIQRETYKGIHSETRISYPQIRTDLRKEKGHCGPGVDIRAFNKYVPSTNYV